VRIHIKYGDLGQPVIWRIPQDGILWIAVDTGASHELVRHAVVATVVELILVGGVECVSVEWPAEEDDTDRPARPPAPPGRLILQLATA
jgi:hypothetical protein